MESRTKRSLAPAFFPLPWRSRDSPRATVIRLFLLIAEQYPGGMDVPQCVVSGPRLTDTRVASVLGYCEPNSGKRVGMCLCVDIRFHSSPKYRGVYFPTRRATLCITVQEAAKLFLQSASSTFAFLPAMRAHSPCSVSSSATWRHRPFYS